MLSPCSGSIKANFATRVHITYACIHKLSWSATNFYKEQPRKHILAARASDCPCAR
jgi:hypothetical protein